MHAMALALLVAAAGGDKMYLSIGKDGTPTVTDYPHGDAVRYRPGDFDKLAMRQKGVPHRGLGVEEPEFGGPAVEITLHGAPQKGAPTAPPEIERLLVAASAKHKVPIELLRAVTAVESAFHPLAVSRVGALGLMQLMPDTARDLGVRNPLDPQENIDGGARYLSFLLRHFKDEELAVAAYNCGPARVAREGKVPAIPETLAYVESVLGLRRAYEGMLP